MKTFLTVVLVIIGTSMLFAALGLIITLLGRFEAPILHGQEVGFVTAVDQQGYFWKTETAFIKTELESESENAYCVILNEVKQKLREASLKRERVEISYSRPAWVGPWECGDEYAIITDLKLSN